MAAAIGVAAVDAALGGFPAALAQDRLLVRARTAANESDRLARLYELDLLNTVCARDRVWAVDKRRGRILQTGSNVAGV